MIKLTKASLIAAVAIAGAVAVSGIEPSLAQGGFPGRPSINAQAFNACTTTNYGDIVAKALNLTSATIRKDIVAGQTVQQLATAAGIDYQTVLTAYETARKADIDQAVKDGVMTQDEATPLEATPAAPGTGQGNPGGQGGQGGQNPAGGPGGGRGGQFGANAAQFPDISTIALLLGQASASGTPAVPGNGQGGPGRGAGGGFGGVGANVFNLVKQYEVVATALNMKCTDLVKTLITPPGESVAILATKQQIDLQTVNAALTKAYKDALAQDVTDTVITQAQADQLGPDVDKAVAAFLSNPTPMGPQATQPAKSS